MDIFNVFLVGLVFTLFFDKLSFGASIFVALLPTAAYVCISTLAMSV